MCVPPVFHLPPATLGHTRHYMPLYAARKRTKVFDTFARIKDGHSLYVKWPDIELTERERKALNVLLVRMGYLGRAESWTEMGFIENAPTDEPNSRPLLNDAPLRDGYESVRTLVCMPPDEYSDWREKTHSEHRERRLKELRAMAQKNKKPLDKVKLGKSNKEKIDKCLPRDPFDALRWDTQKMKNAGWSQPPGSKWIAYTRPRNAFDVMLHAQKGVSEKKSTVARFAVASQVPPRLTDAISLADRIHVALVSRSNGSSVFTGHDSNRKPLQGHKHAFILCESNLALGKGRRGEITHVTVYAPMEFTLKDRIALDGLTKVWGHGGHDVQLILLGVGQAEDFGGRDPDMGQCPLLVESRTWVSRTPFISTRHPKATRAGKLKMDDKGIQIGSPEHELRRLLRENGFLEPEKIECVDHTNLAGHETRWLHFRRDRKNGSGTKSTNRGYGFRITFTAPVRGPIALGYGAHFGLGLFVPQW